MKVVIFSDTHDCLVNMDRAVELVKERASEGHLIHCGDMCAPLTLKHLMDIWSGDIHYCFGNVDGDRVSTLKVHEGRPDVYSHGATLGSLDIGGRSIAFQHFPEVALRLAESGAYDAVFYGHTHLKHSEYIGDTLLANPGNICGIKHPPSFAIYDTDSNSLEHIDI